MLNPLKFHLSKIFYKKETILPKFDKELIASIPNEIWREIFLFSSPIELRNLSSVCREWREITDKKLFQKTSIINHYGSNIFYYFSPFIEEKFITWKKVSTYHPLVSFLSKLVNNYFSKEEDFVKCNNPFTYASFARNYFPKSFVNYEKYKFSICNWYNVKIKEKGIDGFKLFEGDQINAITHIDVKNNLLFCLREDGMIIVRLLHNSSK